MEWTAAGAESAHKYLARMHRLATEVEDRSLQEARGDRPLIEYTHRTIRDVTNGYDSFGFNVSIGKLYGFGNAIKKYGASQEVQRFALKTMAQLMSPITPHLAEEIWSMLGGEGLIADAPWPVADEAMLVEDTVTLPIQINGKRRSEIKVAKDLPKDEVENLVMADDAVIKALAGGQPKKLIVVPGRIVNVVI